MAKYLLMRFSAMGDVAMAIPLLYAVARENPEHHFTILTQPFLTSLLIDPPSNLDAMGIDIKREERGFWGLMSYGERLRREHFDVVIDLHHVLRTKYLGLVLRMCGVPIYSIRKPRKARERLLSRAKGQPLLQIPSMLQLYREVVLRAGLSLPEVIPPLSIPSTLTATLDPRFLSLLQDQTRVSLGIAPFASTDSKTYDILWMEQVVAQLDALGGYRLFLLGGRGKEASVLEEWATRYESAVSVAGQLDLSEELLLLSSLRLVISMDSANMHLASLVGVRVLSIWCATAPEAGFLGLGQSRTDCLGSQDLACRPCSIFGRVKHCSEGDYPCRRGVLPEDIVAHVARETAVSTLCNCY